MPSLPRFSFRQLLLVAFLLVASLLAGVALRGLSTLETLLDRSQRGAQDALQLSSQVARLSEHGVTMERAARQYLVLGDKALRQSFDRAASDAARQVQALAAAAMPAELATRWNEITALVDSQLNRPPAPAQLQSQRDEQVSRAFRELNALTTQMAEHARSTTAARSAALQAELDAGRTVLARQVVAAIALAVLLALGLALALARPLQRVEAAIVGLGENQFDARIDIRGPSDVRQIGRRLDWLRQRLAQSDADKARFLRHVSHELKTPLAALREGVSLLNDGVTGPLSDKQREVARILADNTAALQRRIEDLLRFNAAAFAAERLVRKPTDLGAMVARLIDEQQLQWRARGLQVAYQVLPAGAPLVADVDAELLGTALANLLSNAIRFSPPGGSVRIALARTAEGAHEGLQIDVADQGPGVREAERERIFEPFFRGQTQPEGGLAGTGIGLSIVAETVAAHGGQVQLLPSSGSDKGARFRIVLPDALAD